MIFSLLSCKNIKVIEGNNNNNKVYSEKDLNTIAISLFINETFNCEETPCEICITHALYHDKEIIRSIDNIWVDDPNPTISFPEGLIYKSNLDYTIEGYKTIRFNKECSLKFSPIIYTKDRKRLSGTASYYSGVFIYFIDLVGVEYKFKNAALIRS